MRDLLPQSLRMKAAGWRTTLANSTDSWFFTDDKRSFSRSRFWMASVSTSALLAGAIVLGVVQTHHAGSWVKVFANGRYVGLVPNRTEVEDNMKRVAIGYGLRLGLSRVNTTVNARYDWQAVQSFPMSAVAIERNRHPLVYTATEQDAQQVLARIRQALMPRGVHSNAVVAFTAPIELEKTTVGIADIWSPDADVRYLLHPSQATLVGRSASFSAIVTNGNGPNEARRFLAPTTQTAMKSSTATGGTTDAHRTSAATHPLVSLKVSETVRRTVKIPTPVQVQKDPNLPVGQNHVIRAGKPGRAREELQLNYLNGQLSESRVLQKVVLTQPTTEIVQDGTNDGVAVGGWQWPSPYTDITSGFGWRILFGRPNYHPGVDIGCPIGTPVYASNDGVVEQAGWNNGGYGNWILMSNGNGIETVYGHMSSVSVSSGQTITKGQVIGYSGDTGLVTGPHLHYEVRINGVAVDPHPYM